MSSTMHECLLSFFGWVIRGSFMASILVLLVLMLQLLLKNKLEVRWKYLLWIPVAIRLLLPWAPESSLSLYNVFSLETIVPDTRQQTQNASAWHNLWKRPGEKGEAAAQAENSIDSEKSNLLRGSAQISDSPHESGALWDIRFWWSGFKQLGFINMLMSVWLLGILFFAAKTVFDQLRLSRALRAAKKIETPFLTTVFRETKRLMGVKRDVQFVASEIIPGPAVVGYSKPAILISPSLLVTLQEDQLQYILAHECAHIQRRDVAVNWMMHILLIFHWFNPLLWLAVHKARQDQEMACDAYVLDRISSQEHVQQNHAYGQTIIHVLEHFSGEHHYPGVASLSSTHKQMKRRLIMIKQFDKKSYRLSILGLAMILMLSSVSLVNAKEGNAASAPQKSSVQEQEPQSAVNNEPGAVNPDGKIGTAKPKEMSEGEKLQKAEESRIYKLLEKNPDDTYIVYVSGEILQRKKASTYYMGSVYPKFDTYEDYLNRASALKDAVLQQPVDMPKGYQFIIGEIRGPLGAHDAKEIETEATKLGKKVHSKKINWTTSSGIILEYTNGDDKITLGSRNLDSVDKKQLKQGHYTYITAAENKKEKSALKVEIRNDLIWRDNEKLYYISTNPGNPLTKEDLIKLAKTMVKK
ncbi:M56 family metallopeptidase [Paenibacillaceae sp. P-4]|uniref:M56 family metallopeptidase n=1 Tax=Paenibacillaceae bacterium P-4 TaxID=3160969 RepID=UPI0032E811AA